MEKNVEEVTLGSVAIPRAKKFKYFGLIIQKKDDIDEGINHHIKVRRQN